MRDSVFLLTHLQRYLYAISIPSALPDVTVPRQVHVQYHQLQGRSSSSCRCKSYSTSMHSQRVGNRKILLGVSALESTQLLSHIEVLSVRKAECTQGYWSINAAGSESSQIADAIRQHDTVEIASRSKEFIRKGCNNLLLWQLCLPIKRYCRGDNIIR